MAKQKTRLERKPFVLVIRDGWGYNPDPNEDNYNAVKLARTPIDDMLMAEYPNCLIHTSGEHVGLPAGTMGNSEVGHQNLGAGRVVPQESVRISNFIRDGSFFENKEFAKAIKYVKKNGGKLHLIGLCSDIGVHSRLDHLYGLLELAKRCMSCGLCFQCGNCWMYCQDNAVIKPASPGEPYRFKLEFCQGCKKCAEECPCGYIEMH